MKTQTTRHTPGIRCKRGPLGTRCFNCNALVNATPELLEWVKRYHDYAEQMSYTEETLCQDGWKQLTKELKQAIAKATGGK